MGGSAQQSMALGEQGWREAVKHQLDEMARWPFKWHDLSAAPTPLPGPCCCAHPVPPPATPHLTSSNSPSGGTKVTTFCASYVDRLTHCRGKRGVGCS